MKSSSQIAIAIAYVKINGLRKLLFIAEDLIHKRIKFKILFGLSTQLGITDNEAVKELLTLSKHSNVEVRRFNSRLFHPKFYVFHSSRPSIVVGSSNLTNAAVTKNVEANLLVEDADKILFQDSLDFFNSCFKEAPLLTEKDVKSYSERKPTKSQGSQKIKEDKVPIQFGNTQKKTLLELLNERKKDYFYIMYLSYGVDGFREECWNFAYGYNFIGLSHIKVNEDWVKIRLKMKNELIPIWVSQFNIFCENLSRKSMDIGDLVLIIEGQTHLLGIGEITSNHFYKKEYEKNFFDHVRSVIWIKKYKYQRRIKISKLEGFVNTLSYVMKDSDRWLKLAKIKI